MNVELHRDFQLRDGFKPVFLIVDVPLSFEEKICPSCGALFYARSNAIYDSAQCRNKANRGAKKEVK